MSSELSKSLLEIKSLIIDDLNKVNTKEEYIAFFSEQFEFISEITVKELRDLLLQFLSGISFCYNRFNIRK